MKPFTFQLENSGNNFCRALSKHAYGNLVIQAGCELIDNSISALLTILGKTRSTGKILFDFDKINKCASIEDNGPGFPTDVEGLIRCWSYGSTNPNGLNEHGCGSKTALSIFDKEGSGWKVYWKNEGSPIIHMIQGPLRSTMTVEQVDTWPGKLRDSSGVYMSFPCSDDCFTSLYGRNVKSIDTEHAIQRLRRELANIYLYQDSIASGRIHLEVNEELVDPFVFDFGSESVTKHQKIEIKLLGGDNDKASILILEIKDELKTNSWFKVNSSTMGIRIWKNGRFICHTRCGDLFERITGLSPHPSMNGKFILVNLSGDQKTLPPTDPNKVKFNEFNDSFNGFISELYKVASPFFGTKGLADHERDLMKQFVEQRKTMQIPGYVFNTNRAIGKETPPIDFIEEYSKDDVRMYEGKRTNVASIEAFGQLLTNYILVKKAYEPLGKTITKAILLLNCNPDELFISEQLERQVRALMESTGCPFEIHSYKHGLIWPKPKESQSSVKPKKVRTSKALDTV
jgi:hypothetical protein